MSKAHVTRKGTTLGGLPFSRGALFHLPSNRVYLGEIVHKGAIHQGEHDAIVDRALFARVQDHLDANSRSHRAIATGRKDKAPLTGKLFDEDGEPMSPTFSRGKSGRSYRYYVSASLQQGTRHASTITRRVPAPAIERIVTEATERWTGNAISTRD